MISLVRLERMSIIRLLNYVEYNKFGFDKGPTTSPTTSPITLKDTLNNPLISKNVFASNGALIISLVAKRLGDVITLNSTLNSTSNSKEKKHNQLHVQLHIQLHV